MNLYYIDAGERRFFANKTNAHNAAQDAADKVQRGVIISRMFIAVDRDNIARLANSEAGFSKFVGRVSVVLPRKRPKVKLKRIAATLILFTTFLLPNPSEAASCTTRRSGSVSITTCDGKDFYSQCRSYRSGSVVKTSCK